MKLYGGRPAKHAGSQKSKAARKGITVSMALILIICLAVGGTVAFLIAKTNPVVNIFTPAKVTVDIEEIIENNAKTSITVRNVLNDEDVPCYIRVKLVSNMQDKDDNVTASKPLNKFDIGADWIDGGNGYYYYKYAVDVDNSTTNLLAENASIQLVEGQVVEVLAEGIQSLPTTAVEEAWPVRVDNNGNLTKGA